MFVTLKTVWKTDICIPVSYTHLAIAKSFTENCGGSFKVIIDGDLFKAILKFPEHKSKPVQNADTQKAADTGIEKG